MRLRSLSRVMLPLCAVDGHCMIPSTDGDVAVLSRERVCVFSLRGASAPHGSPPLRVSELMTPLDLPTAAAGQDERLELAVGPHDAAHLVVDPTLSPVNGWSERRPQPTVLQIAWDPSPPATRLLAVLTDYGSVTVWQRRRFDEWTRLLDVSHLIKDHIDSNNFLRKPSNPHDYLSIIKRNCAFLQSTAVTFSNTVHEFTLLFVAQKNGNVYIFKIKRDNDAITSDLHQFIQIDLDHPTIVRWTSPLLLVGCSDGTLQSIEIDLAEKSSKKNAPLWPEEDRMLIDTILIHERNDCLCIVISKRTFIVVIAFDPMKKSHLSTFENVGNLNITNVTPLDVEGGRFLVTTFTGALYEATVSVDETSSPSITCTPIETDLSTSDHSINGAWVSRNVALYGLCLNRSTLPTTKGEAIWSTLVLMAEEGFDPLAKLSRNESRRLTDYRDCFQMMLYDAPRRSTQDWPCDITEDLSVYEIKMRMCILEVACNRECRTFTPSEDVQAVILYDHIKSALSDIVQKYDGDTISDFWLKSVGLYINHLKSYDGSFHRTYPEVLIDEVLAKFPRVSLEPNIVCEWCNEAISLIYCSQRHPRQWCCITLQTITTDEYLFCHFCNHLGHPSLVAEAPCCTFCDAPLLMYGSE